MGMYVWMYVCMSMHACMCASRYVYTHTHTPQAVWSCYRSGSGSYEKCNRIWVQAPVWAGGQSRKITPQQRGTNWMNRAHHSVVSRCVPGWKSFFRHSPMIILAFKYLQIVKSPKATGGLVCSRNAAALTGFVGNFRSGVRRISASKTVLPLPSCAHFALDSCCLPSLLRVLADPCSRSTVRILA